MHMRYFWFLDQKFQEQLRFNHRPREDNLGDLHTKAHNVKDTQRKQLLYVQTNKSSRHLSTLATSLARVCWNFTGLTNLSQTQITTKHVASTNKN